MLTSQQMELALRAVSEIDAQSLMVVTTKMIDDIRSGVYTDGHQLTSRIRVGDIIHNPYWWHDSYYIALVTACASGNLVRLACHAVGVNPCSGDWKQLLTLCTSTAAIEQKVACSLILGVPVTMSA